MNEPATSFSTTSADRPHRVRPTEPLTDPTGSATCADRPSEQAGLDLARELRRRSRAGEPVRAEQLLSRHPELARRPETAVEVVYEEYCLREAAGESDVEQDVLSRFPQWADPLRVMLDCHRRVLGASRDAAHFPEAGERVGDFLLRAELGRGARGRVFLAAQTALADRPVVLEVVTLDPVAAEHLSLARLQHTNIVPLYGAFDDPARGLRVLCMPYFGRATIASVLAALAHVPPAERTGRHVLGAIDRADPAPTFDTSIGSAARQMLDHVTYPQAVCWIAACLADALHFAHERGLVHLDLKPSNVLLASDGQPMLLDFHLAREPILCGAAPPDGFGGTPPYMPPEQQAAMRSLRDGRPLEAGVDRRTDVYALGAILYEALVGAPPAGPDAPPLSSVNPNAGFGLSDVVAKCLSGDPSAPYADAATLAEDLRRHLTDQPLVGVANRSAVERFRKWRRRRPGTLRLAALLTTVAALLVGAGWHLYDRRDQAKHALRNGLRQLQPGGNPAEAVLSFRHGLDRLESLPLGADDLRRDLAEQLVAAQRTHLARQLHELADAVRMLPDAGAGDDGTSLARLRSLAAQCEAIWKRRQDVVDALSISREAGTSEDLQDIAIFAAQLRARLGSVDDPESGRRSARELLKQAEEAFGPSPAIAEHARAFGAATNVSPASRNSRDHCAFGRAYLASGNLVRAEAELAAALRLDPAGRWPNFYAGVCAARAGRHEDAVALFGVCIGAAPDVAGFYYNRAWSRAALGRNEDALLDYDRALAIDPTHSSAALNRGALRLGQRRLDDAATDIRRAEQLGADPATVHYNLALVHLAGGDSSAAARECARALEYDPPNAQARRLAATLGAGK